MIFGDVPVADAEGLILAHSVRLPGGAFKKGRVLSAEDIQVLLTAQIETVSGARLEPDDVGEDEAAEAVARAVTGPGLTLGKAFTGRCNIFAEGHGLAVIDDARVDRLNLLDEAMTLGTVAPHALAEAGQMVATVKVIPFAASRAVVDRCVEIAQEGGPMLRLAPLKARTVGLIQTRLPGMRESVLDSTTGAVATRLAQLDGALARPRSVAPTAVPRWRRRWASFTGAAATSSSSPARPPSSTGGTWCRRRWWRRAGPSTISVCR